MKKLLAALLLTAGLGMGQVSFGFRIGPPPAPRVVRVRPRAPGVGYFWVDGYWYPAGNRYRWHEGYWSRPPYEGYRWVTPRYEGGMFYNGYWDGGRGRFDHDHHWDRDRNRDFGHRDNRRDRDHDRH